ncbi:MAG: hypothetical protein NT120_01665 [Candidatus Aenigmarchaeota archaeon]|nr:hypothetical protein [Candidatus Aenigmarchaeota archaeon]
MKINLTSLWTIVGIYIVFIVGAIIYFIGLQNFGFNGLDFVRGGKNHIVGLDDITIVITLVLSAVLLVLSVAAFLRKKTARFLVMSLVFFFFALKEFIILIENFFPGEHIYIPNAVVALELLILLSFALFVYNSRERKK